jgi:hypothetical protein
LKKWHERIPMTNRFHFPKLSSKKWKIYARYPNESRLSQFLFTIFFIVMFPWRSSLTHMLMYYVEIHITDLMIIQGIFHINQMQTCKHKDYIFFFSSFICLQKFILKWHKVAAA